MDRESFESAARRHFERLRDSEQVAKAKAWLGKNWHRIDGLFNHPVIRDFVFEPLKGVFHVPGKGEEVRARQVITQVALVNAVIAGLPGSLGVGVYVSIALELWMAYALSRAAGLSLSRDQVTQTLIGWAIGVGGVFLLFKEVLNLVFPIITALMPVSGFGTAITQLIVTNLFGVVFWVMFRELAATGVFRLPKGLRLMRSLKLIAGETLLLSKHQLTAFGSTLSPLRWKRMIGRFVGWISGDIETDPRALRGEVATPAVMVWLLANQPQRLEGPLGQEFLESIRDRYPDLAEASFEEIRSAMMAYEPEQMVGVINLVKGRLFERMVAHHENNDSDEWEAVLHDDPSHPGSDLLLVNEQTGEVLEISLKATNSEAYLEGALARYPDYPIIATDEVAAAFEGQSHVWASGLTNEELTKVTEDNFDHLLGTLDPIEVAGGVVAGSAGTALIRLWPFVVAYMRKRITAEQLEVAIKRVLPNTGAAVASRLAYAAVLGPLFAWWILARAVMGFSATPERQETTSPKRLRQVRAVHA